MSGQPFIKFFPTDWQADPAVRMCSLAARGLWFEMLCLMHEAGGYLQVGDKEITPGQLARLVGTSQEEVEGLLAELEEASVFSRNRDRNALRKRYANSPENELGVIYCRRMVRDCERSELPDPTARDRMRRFRNKKRNGHDPQDPDTPHELGGRYADRNADRNANVTDVTPHGARQSPDSRTERKERTGTKVVPLARASARETTSPPQGFESLFRQAEEIAAGDRSWLGTMTTGLIACDADFKRGKAYLDAVSRNPRLPARNPDESRNRFVTYGQQLIREEEDRLNGTRPTLLAPRRA